MKYEIKNFTDASTVEVSEATGVQEFGPLVCLCSRGGSLHFQHTMTPAQAREMAAALIACADAQEADVNAELAAHRESLAVKA